MTYFRVTKYNPQFRNSQNVFLRPEWTSISDIGKDFDGEVLTLSEYLRVESLYLEAIGNAIEMAKPKNLYIHTLGHIIDLHTGIPESLIKESQELIAFIQTQSGTLTYSEVRLVARAVLRELVWCKIEGDGGFYIHFGWDYYMYIGDASSRLNGYKSNGLYSEDFSSPYRVIP